MTSLPRLAILLIVLLASTASTAAAQGTLSSNGFQASVRLEIRAMPTQVFGALLRVGEWWSPAHTHSGNAKNLSIDARPGGCFCESLPTGGGVEHLRVVFVAPGSMLRMSGALGPLQSLGVVGSLTVTLKPTFAGTSLDLVYSVGGFSEGGFSQLAPAVQGVLAEQMNRLKSYVENGRPAF